MIGNHRAVMAGHRRSGHPPRQRRRWSSCRFAIFIIIASIEISPPSRRRRDPTAISFRAVSYYLAERDYTVSALSLSLSVHTVGIYLSSSRYRSGNRAKWIFNTWNVTRHKLSVIISRSARSVKLRLCARDCPEFRCEATEIIVT